MLGGKINGFTFLKDYPGCSAENAWEVRIWR